MSRYYSRLRNLLACGLALWTLCGCVAYVEPYGATQSYSRPGRHYNIPPGHMPPPGACRIWFPDRPPGQQPPPGDCYDLERRVPPGAVLIRG